MAREASKCEKAKEKEKKKVKKAMEQGNNDIARVYAENAIRNHNQSLNFLKLSSRLDAVVSRLQSANAMKQMGKQMVGVSQAMDAAIKTMDVDKIARTVSSAGRVFVLVHSMDLSFTSTIDKRLVF